MPQQTRRSFLGQTAAGLAVSATAARAQGRQRPNILWITSEDNGPHMGCYGDERARTPNLDRLAQRGLIYQNAWSNAPVCAPARTAIISGMYPPSTGSEHMRSETRLPPNMLMYPQYLREHGYYCTNNEKKDYNLQEIGTVWDESSRTAHWRKRRAGQPFFSIFNFITTHESQIRIRPHKPVHDPANIRIPAYHPDVPEVRQDWAQYYDKMTEMDGQAGAVLRQLEEDGLAEDTIVFYYGDHGPGMPRSKRWPYNSGLRVPLIVSLPEKYRHLAPEDYKNGGSTDRLVGFVDLAPTLLSLTGIRPPAHLQGHAFMGEHPAPEQPYIYGFRGRMDERLDMVRSVRDKRYIYIRNYMPHKIYGQYLAYMFETPTTQRWKELYDQGKLEPPKTYFWEQKPAEELYDLETDPDEVKNLAGSAAHRATLDRLRKAQQELAVKIRDVGFLPEDEIHKRSEGSAPHEMASSDAKYPVRRVMSAAEAASSLKDSDIPALAKAMGDRDSAVRYWAAMGYLMRGNEAVQAAQERLRKAMQDESPSVCIIAAQALAQFGDQTDVDTALPLLIGYSDVERHGLHISLLALNALEAAGDKLKPYKEQIAALPAQSSTLPQRLNGYVPRMLELLKSRLG